MLIKIIESSCIALQCYAGGALRDFLLMIVLIIIQNDGFHYDIRYLRILMLSPFMFTPCLHSLVPSPFGPFAPLKYSPFALISTHIRFCILHMGGSMRYLSFLPPHYSHIFSFPFPLDSFLYPLSTTSLSC